MSIKPYFWPEDNYDVKPDKPEIPIEPDELEATVEPDEPEATTEPDELEATAESDKLEVLLPTLEVPQEPAKPTVKYGRRRP